MKLAEANTDTLITTNTSENAGGEKMSIVIVGGHDRMAREYQNICKRHGHKSKVFTQMPANMKSKIGSPDLLVLFTSTVSHKMMRVAVCEAEKCNAEVVRSHTSSASALEEILANVSVA